MDIKLDPLLIQIREQLDRGTYLSQTAQLRYCDAMTVELRAHVLAQQLPPKLLTHYVRESTPQLIKGETPVRRFATWRDHFKATHQGRWWMRWRRWRIRYIEVAVPFAHTHVFDCRHTVEVAVRDHWSFPEARIAVYPEELGGPVMVSITESRTVRTEGASRPWRS